MLRKLFSKLWADDSGFVISTELMFVAVILVIGVVAGLASLRNGVNSELEVVGNAILGLNPGFNITSAANGGDGSAGGSVTEDTPTPGAGLVAGSTTVPAGGALSVAPSAVVLP